MSSNEALKLHSSTSITSMHQYLNLRSSCSLCSLYIFVFVSYIIIQLILQTFADWGVDMLKKDGCDVVELMDAGYQAMSLCLNLTQRPIVFSCSWPDYVRAAGMFPDYKRVAEYCNLWRNYDDINVH